MSALSQHIQGQQDTACLLSGVIDAAIFVHDENGPLDALASLLRAAHRLAQEVHNQLDTVNLPKGGDA